MEQSQNGTPPANSKEKKSFLDEDIGKDFLSSWKSMAATEDDGMDFSFNMASSGKNKKFNFEKLDMDFGLDGDFDKLDSFKVDMSDFDLPATSKKAAKPKESSADESSDGKVQGKKGPFNFSFDFNELDNFNFESSPGKEEKVSKTSKDDQKKNSSVATEQKSSNTKLSGDSGAFDDTTAKELLLASKPLVTSSMETSLTGQKHTNALTQDFGISSDALDSSCNLRSSPEKAITKRAVIIDQETHVTEKANCSPDRSFITSESDRSSIVNDKAFTSYPKDDENGKITEQSSSHEIVPSKNLSQSSIIGSRSLGDEKNKPDTDSSTDTMDDHESDLRELDLRENSKSFICTEASSETKEYKENQNSATELPTDPSSEPVVAISTSIDTEDARALNVEPSKEEESALETEYATSEREQTVPTSLETKTMGLHSDEVQPGNTSDSSNPEPAARELTKGEDKNARHSSNIRNFPNKEGLNSSGLPSISKQENRKLVVSTSENTVKVHNAIGFQGSSSILLRKEDKFNSPASLNTKRMASSLESVKKSKMNPIEGSELCSVKSPKKISNLSVFNISKIKSSVKVPDSAPKKDISSLQNPKHGKETQNNAASEMAYLQNGINISKTKRSVKVPDSASKDINVLQNPKHTMETQDNAASEKAYLQNGTENKLPHSISLKRKAFELPNSELASRKPLKRLSPPVIIRGLNEPSKQVVEVKLSSAAVKNLKPIIYRSKAPVGRDLKQPSPRVDDGESMRKTQEEKVCRQEEQKESKSRRSLLYSVPFAASETETPRGAKMMDLELSSKFESHGNMEKAEAYAKELEDICNMLKKKHEEAKDVLIRALVNNNNLLMLNHPIHDDNICKVQKFAARLMSKELQT